MVLTAVNKRGSQPKNDKSVSTNSGGGGGRGEASRVRKINKDN